MDNSRAKEQQRISKLCVCVYLPSGFNGFVLVNFFHLWKLIIDCLGNEVDDGDEDDDDDNNNIGISGCMCALHFSEHFKWVILFNFH